MVGVGGEGYRGINIRGVCRGVDREGLVGRGEGW